MNTNIVHADFSASNQAPALDAEILRMAVIQTIDEFGHHNFATSLTEVPQMTLKQAA